MRKLLLIGGGGHCKSVLDCVLTTGLYDDIGIIDKNPRASALGFSVIGSDDDLPRLRECGWTDAFITVGSIGNTDTRHRLYRILSEIGFTIPSIIDPTSVIAHDATICEGVFIGKRAVVNTNSKIGYCAIVNTAAILEHDCVIGDFTHISPGSVLCGQVTVGNGTHIGAGATVRQLIKIGNKAVIGIGSVVVKDIPDNVRAYGNPCKVVD